MKKILSITLAISMLVLLLAACGDSGPTPADPTPADTAPADPAPADTAPADSEPVDTADDSGLVIGLIVMSTNSEYWLTVMAGAREATDAIGAELIFQGPADNNDIQGQVALVENLVNARVDAILLTPLDGDALVPPVDIAMEAGIPVVIVDSALNSDNITSFIATDNVAGGALAMEKLSELLGNEGEVVVINALAGIPSNDARGRGAEEYAATVPGLVVLPQQHGLDQAEAMANTENVIIANPNLRGIFGAFNRGALGAAQALINMDRQDDIILVAFDADPDQIRLLEEGVIDALIVQQPFQMGKMGVEFAVRALNGEDVPSLVSPDVVLVTRDNMNDPDIAAILNPS